MQLQRLIAAADRRHYQPLVMALVAVSTGIVVDRYAPPAFGMWILGIVAALSCAAAMRLLGRRGWASASLLMALGCTGAAWHHARWYLFAADDLGRFTTAEPQSVTLEARIVEAPRFVLRSGGASPHDGYFESRAAVKTRCEIDISRALLDGAWRECGGRADLDITGRAEGIEAGDTIAVRGRLFGAAPPLNPGEFDFAAHYRSERKLCVVRVWQPSDVAVVEYRSAYDLPALVSQWRRRAHDVLLENVPSDQVGFASALLLGYRDQMERRDNQAFFRTGTVHILSISGLHIGILAYALHLALRMGWLRRTAAIWTMLAITLAYTAIIDAEPPAMRAAIVVALCSWAMLIGRRALGFNTVAASALIVLAINPCDLFRAGPQLSFLAAAVLAWLADTKPAIEPEDAMARLIGTKAARFTKAVGKWTRRTFVVSGAIFVATTPLVAYRFHIMSPISLVLTPILAVPVALALIFGFLTLLVGGVVPPFAASFGMLAGWMLRLIEFVVTIAQHWPGAVWLPGPSLWQVCVFHALAMLYVLSPRTIRWRVVVGGAASAWMIATMIPRYELPPHLESRVTFIAVGHGLSILVEGRGGDPWLYDCGSQNGGENAARSIAAVLWSRGITRLEGIVISHTDVDHYDALPYLVEQFRVGGVYGWAPMFDGTSSAGNFIRDEAARQGVPVHALVAGDRLPVTAPGFTAEVLMPSQRQASTDDNLDSLIVLVESADRRILLTGDIAGIGLADLLKLPPVDCDVLSVPHHGSDASNPAAMAAWSLPEWAVISDNAGDRDETIRAYTARGATVLNTAFDGAVTIDIARDRLEVRTFR